MTAAQQIAPLSARRKLFVDAYLVQPDAKRAALEAGYSGKTAKQQGPRLLKNSTVAAAIEVAQAERAERLQITADDVLCVAWAIATNADEPASARVSALALCAKHTGGFVERVETKHEGDITIVRNTPSTR